MFSLSNSGVRDGKAIDVTYFDYGNDETVSETNTRKDTSFTSLPRQSIKCQLNRIDYSKSIEHTLHEKFRTMCLNNTFTAQFVSQCDPSSYSWSVELFHPSGKCTLTGTAPQLGLAEEIP